MALRHAPSGLGRGTPLPFALSLTLFVVLATLNSGGYRYGASDQAFYVPAILEQLDPGLFPRDTAVLAAQTRLTVVDDVIALIVRALGVSLPAVFAGLYVVALALFAWGAWLIGRRLYQTQWAAVALLAALTLRHAIAKSGTNTLEGYFHPRLLAYGLGAVAIACFLRGRLATMALLLVIGALVHPTTALWFGVWLGIATALADRALRPWVVGASIVGTLASAWALTAGPLAGRLVPLDAEWRRMLETKDYLFPLAWPAYAWVLNLGYLPLVGWIHVRRKRAGVVDRREQALVAGSVSLLVIFAGALVLHVLDVALAFQLQPARVFWMFDFLAVVYAVWLVAEGASGFSRKKPLLAATLIASLAAARGIYVLMEAQRPPVQLTIRDDDWGRVMAWARATDTRSGWLADPMHAVLYGTSVRVAGERDVLVEAVKDAAIGMYDRQIAVRTDERLRAVESFNDLTATRARELAARYDLDYVVTENDLDLPLAFESGALRVYRLK